MHNLPKDTKQYAKEHAPKAAAEAAVAKAAVVTQNTSKTVQQNSLWKKLPTNDSSGVLPKDQTPTSDSGHTSGAPSPKFGRGCFV